MLSDRVAQAIKQLKKADDVLKHLVRDFEAPCRILKTLMLPNLRRADLKRVVDSNEMLKTNLCACLGLHPSHDPVPYCLTSDDVSSPADWWKCRMTDSGSDPAMTDDTFLELLARFGGPATTVKVFCSSEPRLSHTHRSDVRTRGEGVSETGGRFAPVDVVLHPRQTDILDNPNLKLVYLTGPPGTGKSLVLLLKGAEWLRQGKPVHIVSLRKESLAASFAIQSQLERMEPCSKHLIHLHIFDLPLNRTKVLKEITGVDRHQTTDELFVILEEAWDCYTNPAPLHQFCDELNQRVVNLNLWTASFYPKVRPQLLDEVVLTAPLRTPPSVTLKVQEHRGFIGNHVYSYDIPKTPLPCDGPPARDVIHDGPGHSMDKDTPDCEQCGREIAKTLKELDVGKPARDANCPQPPTKRDVFILTYRQHFHDEERDAMGNVTKPASGLVQGVRKGGFPVSVLKSNDIDSIREVATKTGPDEVVAANSIDVNGLERKIVIFVQNDGPENTAEDWGKLWAISRCTAQVVWLRRPRPPKTSTQPARSGHCGGRGHQSSTVEEMEH